MPESGPTGTIPTGAPKLEGQMSGPSSVEEMPVVQAPDQLGSEHRADAGLAIDPISPPPPAAAEGGAPEVPESTPETVTLPDEAAPKAMSPEELSHQAAQQEHEAATTVPSVPEDNIDVPATSAATNVSPQPSAAEQATSKPIGPLKRFLNLFRKQPGEEEIIHTNGPIVVAKPTVNPEHLRKIQDIGGEAGVIPASRRYEVSQTQSSTPPPSPEDHQDKLAA